MSFIPPFCFYPDLSFLLNHFSNVFQHACHCMQMSSMTKPLSLSTWRHAHRSGLWPKIDLCVALLVMPLALYSEVSPSWGLGQIVCNMWVSFDVTCCTASILNLCTISIDRYFTITRPLTYGVNATARRSFFFIAVIWVASCLISVPPLLIFGNEHGTTESPECQVSQNIIYQLYATLGAFYIPLLVMIVMYYKIYVAARRVVEAELKAQPSSISSGSAKLLPLSDRNEVLLMHTSGRTHPTHPPPRNSSTSLVKAVSESVDQQQNYSTKNYLSRTPNGSMRNDIHNMESLAFMSSSFTERDDTTEVTTTSSGVRISGRIDDRDKQSTRSSVGRPPSQQSSVTERTTATLSTQASVRSSSDLRERKASVTLGVIMTAFTVCWLPFFILAVLRPFSQSVYSIPPWIVSFALWLGYANSMLNPIIYVTFHQDFRKAFRYLLCFQCASLGTRLREEAFQSQYGQTQMSSCHVGTTASGATTANNNSHSASIVKTRKNKKKKRVSLDQVP